MLHSVAGEGEGEGGEGGAVAVRGLSRGRVSRAFTADDLADALSTDHDHHHNHNHAPCVYVELDAEGWVTCAGAGGAGGAGGAAGGAARGAVRARLAGDLPARTALLELAAPHTAPHPAYRLRVEADVAPHEELLLWFHEDVLALLDMPFLTLRNIRGRKDYVCHECGSQFERPNPLKVHLFLACAPYSRASFWRRALPRLRVAPAAPTATLAAPAAAPSPSPCPSAALVQAQLEALAAEWGRGRDGHLCLYCGKVYSRKYGLKIHIRTHTGYRPLRCRHCARAFGDPSNLNKHVRLHAARRDPPARYSCATCGRAAARRRDLLRHERAHHAHPTPTTPSVNSHRQIKR